MKESLLPSVELLISKIIYFIKGYYILLRETTSAIWQKKIFTADNEIRLPYSKDNYFFAVQSVNEAGNESLPIVPGVGR
jgi:hypothetical protein